METDEIATKANIDEAMDDDDDDDDLSSSDDSDDSDSEGETEILQLDDSELAKLDDEIMQLSKSIQDAPYTYDLHVQLISALRRRGGRGEDLRAAREKMAELFPLAETLWLEWFSDETADKDFLSSLFERAVKDYTSLKIWLEMFYNSMSQMSEPGGIEAVRQVAERAISAVGLNVAEGSQIWEAYREFENAILATLQPAPGAVASAETLKQISDQTERVAALFKRQLSVPLIGMEKTMAEYEGWIDGSVDDVTKKKYDKATALLKQLRPYEQALAKSTPPNQDTYAPYIDLELKLKDASRIQTLFERALKDNCLIPDLWIRYIRYMCVELKEEDLVLSITERAVRNCPWSAGLWVEYLQALECFNKSHDDIKGVLSRGLTSGLTQPSDYLQLWTAYIDYLRRQIDWSKDHAEKLEELRSAFERAINELLQNCSTDGDPECSLTQYWAYIEAKHCKNMSKARELWSQLMQQRVFIFRAQMWLEYIRLERCYGDVKHCRKIIQKALHSVTDWPESICQAYLCFERQEGDLESYRQAVERCEAHMKQVQDKRDLEALKESMAAEANKKGAKLNKKGQQQQQHEKGKWGGESSHQGQQQQRHQQPRQQQQQRAGGKWGKSSPHKQQQQPRQQQQQHKQQDTELRPYQKVSARKSAGDESDESSANQESGGWAKPVVFVRGQGQKRKHDEDEGTQSALQALAAEGEFKLPAPPPGRPRGVNAGQSDVSPPKRARIDDSSAPQVSTSRSSTQKDSCTVFVSNLDFNVTEQTIKAVFSNVGTIVEIRLVTDYKGRSKGYAYVEFRDELSRGEALKKDRELIDGRPMFVSEYNKNPSSTNKLKYSSGLEKNKLFIRGLSFSTTQEELEKCFSEHGKLKSVRLATYRNGTPKGLAYVEYETEESASEAVLKKDGFELEGHKISVAISNPPARKERKTPGQDLLSQEITRSFIPSLGGGKKDTGIGRGKARTQLSLVPRSVNHPPAANNNTASKQNSASNSETNGSSASTSSKLSNADFRSMLLKK